MSYINFAHLYPLSKNGILPHFMLSYFLKAIIFSFFKNQTNRLSVNPHVRVNDDYLIKNGASFLITLK